MSSPARHNRSLLIFYFLVGYVILQFSWWAYHIFTLAKKASDSDDFVFRKVLMITGEASVFVIILFVGVYFVRKSFKKELELAQEKKNFMLSVTHELKTPIASSKLFVETLINRELPKDKQLDILQKINTDQERLQNLVENILFASKMEEHLISINKSSVDVGPFIRKVVSDLNLNHPTQFNIPNDTLINVDVFYFTSVIRNLHENAVKYSNGEGTIEWKAESKGNNILLQVIDQGIGIENDEKKKIFELFHRGGDEDIRSFKGTGIGLFIVKKIVALHNGAIGVRNNKPKGSIFEIELPKV